MKYSNTVEYNISTKLDSSGLTKLQSQIKQLENSMQHMANRELLNSDKVQAAKTQLEGLNTALTNSFNSSLGILDLSKFRAELDAGGVSAKGLQSAFNMMGTEGQAALSSLTTQIANFNGGMERTSSTVDKIFTTFSNTFRWGMVSSFFSQFMNAIHSSIDYVKELDDSLTQIMLVTDYNRDSMNEFARSANEAAKAVSMTTTGMTNASLIFAQQGYNLNQSQELATLSAKVANASQQDTATTSDQITAYMNAYGLENSIGELTQAMDNWALIANISAADVGELAQASQRAASMANAVGVSGEALAAQIATIESVTREAPEQIGNGLKTLYARFSDIALGGEDEDGIGLGKVTATLEGIGVKVLDQFGNIRTMDDIMEDLMVVWDDLDSTTKTAAAQALAGKYQVNRFEALMENSDMYRQYKSATGENATGTLDTMNEEYANSIAGRSAKMQASLEGLFSTVFNTDDIYPWMDAAQGAIDLLQQFFDALGGGKTILLGITTLLSQAFNQNIARNINDAIANRNLAKIREQNIATVSDTLDKAGIDRTQGVGKYIADTADQAKLGALSDAQYDNYISNVKELEESAMALRNAEREMTKNFDSYNMVMNKLGQRGSAATRSEEEGLNTTQGSEDVASNSKKKIQDFELDFSDDIKQAQKLEKQLQEVRKALDELHEANKKGIGTDEAVEKVQEKAKEVKDTLKDIEEAAAARDKNENRTIFEVGDTPKEIETAIDNIQALSSEVEEDAREADRQLGQVEERIRTIHEEAVKFSSDPKATQAMALTGDQKLASDQTVISGLEARKKRAEDIASGSAQSIIDQQQIKDVLDFVQGIQELTVAWQAFQNLGELWSNKDLLIGEKILQTVMNLAVVIPSVIDAYEKLRKVGSVIKTLGTLQEALAAKSIAATAATSGFSVANLALATSSKVAAGGVGILKAALEGLSSIPVVAAVGAIIIALQYLQSEFQKSQDAATESFNKYGEALNQTQIDTSSFDEAYQKYKETRIVSDELRDSALELTESLDITGGEAYIASGNFDALAKSIEEAKKESDDFAESMADQTLSRLEANSKKYIPFMQDTFSAETLTADNTQGIYFPGTEHIWDENLKLNYFDAFGRDISGMDFGEKIEDISKKSEIANKNLDNLIERKEKLEKKDPAKLTNDEQLFLQDIEEKIRKAEETANVLESLLGREDVQQYQQITNQEKARNLKNLDDTISNDIENQRSIFNTGKYNEAKDYLLQQKGVDTSNVDMLIEKYAQLAENEELAAEAALKVRDQQIKNNELITDDQTGIKYRAGEKGKFLIDEIGKQQDWSDEDKAKISNMIDWSDPGVDQKVIELLEQIQQRMNDGLSLDEALKVQNPEDVKAAIAEMEPRDTDLEVGPYREMAEYLREFAGELEGVPEQVGQNSEMLQDFTEAILRYDDAIQDADENLSDWKDLLLNTAEAAEDDAVYLEDLMEAFEGMRDMIGDLLDMDVSDLSQQFMQNSDVLDILDKAIYGVGEEADLAYDQLNYLAQLDMAGLIDWTDGIDDELAAWDTALPSLEANMDSLSAAAAGLGDDASYAMGVVQDILGGSIPGPDLDLSSFITGLEQMVNDGKISVAQAMAAIDGAGYSAEVTQGEAEGTNTESHIDATPEETEGVSIDSQITGTVTSNVTGAAALQNALDGSGTTTVSWQGNVPGIKWTMTPAEKSTDVTANATGVKYKANTNGGGAGQVHFTNVKAKPSGSTKRNTSGNGNHSRPSSPGGSCFIAGTLVTTLTGFKPIEEIQKGDIVLSYNEKIKVNEYSEVLQTMIHDTIEPIYTLHIKDEQLRVTGIHRFLVIDKITCGIPQWVHATDLKVGNWVMFADGSWHVIHKIDVNIEHRIVYNFEVSYNHNYYVGRNQILAHNKKSGGGKSCFVAGTQISTINGFRVIESIQPNDIVLSYNEQTKRNEYSSVVQTMIHDTKEPIYTLYIQNEQLRVTGIHRFFIINDIVNGIPEWIAAENLKVGQWVLFADGTWHVIHKIKVNIEQQTVYNFEVSGNHNYYVGRNQILAHNKSSGGKKSCFVAGTQVSTSLGFKPIETIQPDDVVLSYNEQTGHNEYSSVIQTMIHDTIEPIYTLYVQNEKLRVTGIHRFFITKNILINTPQWIAAENLKVGDWVLLADGTWHVIWKIEINIEHQTVYNFEVSRNHNYYVGYNQILAHNKGGGKNQKEIKNKEKKEHEKDYYEEVNTQLDKTEKMLSKIEKEEDRLIGDKARANQNKQISYLKKQYLLLSNKRDIQKEELKDVDTLLKKREKEARNLAMKNHVKFDIPEAVYDGEGAIANYEEMSAAIDKIHNQLIDKYNKAAKAGNEKTTKALEETISKFDKYGEDILKNAKRHDKLQVELQDTENQLEEINDQIEDIRIEAYKAHQEALDELKDLKEEAGELAALFRDFNDEGFMTKWSLDDTPMDDMIKSMYELDNIYNITKEDANDFYQDLINKKQDALNETTDEDEKEAIQASINYFKQQQANLSSNTLQNGLLGLANQDLQQLQGWIDGTNTEFNPFGENEAALWEAYEDAYKRSIELFKDWRETIQDLRDSIIDTYDEQEDAIERNIDNYDRILDHLERINDTYTLYYGENSYDGILNIMDQQGATMEKQLADLTTAFDYWSARYQEALKTGDQKLIQEIKAKMDDAQEAMYDKAEELAEHWVERYEKAIDASIQKIDTKLWGGGPGQMDFEDQTMIWELQKDYMDNYKDDVEKAYEIDKLRSKYTDLLNDAQGMSLQTQNKIRAQMQEQLDLLQNQTTMSEYDVKLANARLEILQKQIALEDAQRNKNKMQLRRDTQGNYRYVYTADQGDVKQAQDELNESEFNAYEITKEQTIANNDRAINLYQDYMNKMRDIANKYKDDDVARNAAMKALSEEYGKLLEALGEDFKDTTNGMYDVLVWLVENGTKDTSTAAKDMLDQLYDKNGEVKENTGNDWRDLATQISQEVLPNIEEAVSEGLDNISSSADSLKDQMTGDNGVLTKIGSSTDTLKQSMEEATEQTEKWAKATRDLFESFSPDNVKVQEAMSQLTSMSQQLSQNQQATSALSTAYKTANQKLQSKTAEARAYQTAYDYATGAKNFKKGDTVTIKKGTYVTYNRDGKTQYDDDKNVGFYLPQDFKVKIHHTDEHDHGHISKFNIGIYPTGSDQTAWGKMLPETFGKDMYTSHLQHEMWHINENTARQSLTFDTGGYTGDWNGSTDLPKNGKWAVLHQKELVLNAADTKNILAAVSFMREMFGTNMTGLKEFARLDPSRISDNYNPMTEQRVEIQATFPNATDADDIRTALLELSDKAYQYAHRTI